MSTPHTVSLSLVSHTNVGKTTLARTLLGRDIGEVRDAAHVTDEASAHALIETAQGDRLLLWDTPGFGDSQRLARRMALAAGPLTTPLGWLLTEVWDRWRDRPQWASQRVLRHVLAQSDLVLYLVNAAEEPDDAGYLDAELQVLSLTGKPVVALLNQLGAPGSDADEDALTQRWQQRLAAAPVVRHVLPLDAFTRCWVQEGRLWQVIAPLLSTPDQAAFERLRAAWQARQQAVWRAAVAELAHRVARAALDREPVPAAGWRGGLRAMGRLLGIGADAGSAPSDRAMAALAERLDVELRRSTNALIAVHGLDGLAGREVCERLARHYAVQQPLNEGKAALWGGLVTGALAGLKADIVSGGLTLGGGLLAGGVVGALSAAGAARGVNRIRGIDEAQVAWAPEVLDALLANALLAYLAVAHHGRGRGAWVAAAPPQAWVLAVAAVLAERRAAVAAAWALRQATPGAVAAESAAAVERAVQALLTDASCALLARLYPDAPVLAPGTH